MLLIVMVFLIQVDSMPIQMGPVGTILMTLLAVSLAAFNAYQWRKSSEASHWRGAAQAYESELGIVRERCTRIENENKEQVKAITELQAKTDLTKLQSQAEQFQRESQLVHAQIVDALKELSIGHADRYAKATETMNQNTQAMQDMARHMMEEFGFHKKAFTEISSTMERLMIKVGATG